MVRKAKRKIQFQLGWGGIFAIAVSTLCVLVWMFVLGLWTGQKLVGHPAATPGPLPKSSVVSPPPLMSSSNNASNVVTPAQTLNNQSETDNSESDIKEQALAPKSLQSQAISTKDLAVAQNATEENQPSGNSTQNSVQSKSSPKQIYFVLQIASYRDKKSAVAEARRWRLKGYDCKVHKADLGPNKGVWYRVYLGRFNSTQEAMTFARSIAKKEGLRSYIVTTTE